MFSNECSDSTLVCFELIDFNFHEVDNSNFVQLRKRLSSRKRRAFSMQFTKYNTIGTVVDNEDDQDDLLDENGGDRNDGIALQFKYPSDVKIARLHGCLVISDDHNERILFLDLHSYALRTEFKLEQNVTDFWIEEGYGGDEFLYFGEEKETYKFNLDDILGREITLLKEVEPLWKIVEPLSGSIVIVYDSVLKQKILLRWNNTESTMDYYRDCDGSLIQRVRLDYMCDSPGLFAISNTELFALNHELSTIVKLKLGQGELSKTEIKNSWNHPLSMAIDVEGNRFFLSDYGNNRIVVLDWEGKEITSHQELEPNKLSPFGIKYDDYSGLLYVVDQQASVIKVFQ